MELAGLLGGRFIERRDVKAWQCPPDDHFEAWHYRPDESKVTLGDLRTHLSGKRSMGHYMLGPDNRCRLFAFDIDLRKDSVWDDGGIECDLDAKGVCAHHSALGEGVEGHVHWSPREAWLNGSTEQHELLTNDLVCMAEGLARRTHRVTDLHVAMTYSGGKGVHVYAFTPMGETMPAADARAVANSILESYGCFVATRGNNFWRHDSAYTSLEIETYPKQDTLEGKKLGNLMRLPLGVHGATGHQGMFLRVEGPPMGRFLELDPMLALDGTLPWKD